MEAIRLLKRRPWGIAGAVIILLVIMMAALAPLVAPYGYNEMSLAARLLPPGGAHLLGTDNLGRDLFSRLLYGARPYVRIGLIATAIALVLGAILGVVSARLRGGADSLMRRAAVVPALLVAVFALLFGAANMPYIWWRFLPAPFPFFVLFPFPAVSSRLLLQVSSVIPPQSVPLILTILLSLVFLPSIYASVRRASLPVESVRDIMPANGSGGVVRRLLALLPLLLVDVGVAVGIAVLAMTPLDYMGFGFPPPTPTWGNMMSGAGHQYMLQAPWMVVPPGIGIWLAGIGAVLFGLALREVWVPRITGPSSTAPVGPCPTQAAGIGGFWARWVAALLDILIFAVLGLGIIAGLGTIAPLQLILGLSWGSTAVLLFLFWLWGGATPGKMLMRLKVVPVQGGPDLTGKRVLMRMLGYLVSMLTIGIGFVPIAFDSESRSLADRMAGTVVVSRRPSAAAAHRFPSAS